MWFVFFPQQLYKIVPIKDIRNLYVTFPIPDLQKYYKSNPGHYLGHLIGHEGPGSLLSELKSKGESLGSQLMRAVPHLHHFFFFNLALISPKYFPVKGYFQMRLFRVYGRVR